MTKPFLITLLIFHVCILHAQVQRHTLEPFLADQKFGTHQLPLVWAGEQAIAYQTGYYAYGSIGAMTVPEKDFIRLDRFSNCSKMWAARQLLDDSTMPATNRLRKVYSYVPVIPSDSELVRLHDDSTFTNLFKLNHNTLHYDAFPRQTFSFYTLGSNNTITVAEITIQEITGSPKTNIQVILIKRGALTPQKR